MTQLLPPKKEVALALLERSNVDVYLDPRAKGVVLPPQFRKEHRLILKIGLNMPVPIPDLRLDDESMSCTLSFNRSPFYCIVPWPSVFAMVGEDGRGMVWPDDVPQELAVRVLDETRKNGDRESPLPATPRGENKRRSRATPQVEPLATPADRSSRPKRSKKKKDEPPRPMLVAVPPAPPAAPRDDRAAPAPAPAREAERPSRPSATPPPRSRPKRELPPYLRVVK